MKGNTIFFQPRLANRIRDRLPALLTAFCLFSIATDPAVAWQQTLAADGTPLVWDYDSMPVAYEINRNGSQDTDLQETIEATRAGFARWEALEGLCLCVDYLGTTNRQPNFEGEGDGHNTIGWIEERWPYAAEAIAITTVLFYGDGEIFESDMELNGRDHTWAVLDDQSCERRPFRVDVENIVTHEAGHFYGLAHSGVFESTMFPNSPGGECSKRSLDIDDIEGITEMYACSNRGAYCGQNAANDDDDLPADDDDDVVPSDDDDDDDDIPPPPPADDDDEEEGNSCANANGTGHRLDILILLGGLVLAQRRSQKRRWD